MSSSTYLFVRLKVKYGQVARCSEIVTELVPILEAGGWKLLEAYETVVGDLTEVIDLWEVPDANAIGSVVAHAAATNPEFARLGAELSEVVVEEHLSIVAKLPYSP